MTTFVQVSPHFPESNVYFVEHLASAGVTVLGIGDVWDGQLSGRLRGAMADYYRAHAAQYGISYIIFNQHIWSVARSSEGWRFMADRGSDTQNHKDHVHVSFN